MTETRWTNCRLCHPRCGAVLDIEDGHAIESEEAPYPTNPRGQLCSLGRVPVDHLHHFARFNHPLKRVDTRCANQGQPSFGGFSSGMRRRS